VNQYRRNANITGEKVDQNRVVLTMVPVGGAWKVSHAVAV
jgi:Mce-associated membrane protein